MITTAAFIEIVRVSTIGALIIKFLSSLRKPKIFVQIASYRDPECQHTVQDLFEKAKYPKRINVGICWQVDREKDQECFKVPYKYPKQVRVIEVPAKDGKGVCWARNLTQKLFRGEKYTLMIDSHMRFVDYWDEEMIEQLKLCDSKKAVLTCYPASYTPPNNLQKDPKPIIQRPNFFNKNGDLGFKGEFLDSIPSKPLKGLFIAAGFMFSRSEVIKEVPYDPIMYFTQEELSYLLRLYTHGWDVYHPNKVLIYHYYKDAKQTAIPLHWSDNKAWTSMKDRGAERLKYLLKQKDNVAEYSLVDIDKYGLGKVRTLEQFESESGIDFKKREVSEYGMRAKFIKELPLYLKKGVFIPELDAPKPVEVKNEVENMINIGDIITPFILPDQDGNQKKTAVVGSKKIVLMFLPVDFPAFLEEISQQFSANQNIFVQKEVSVICIINGNSAEAKEIKEKYKFFPTFLSDERGNIYEIFGRKQTAKINPYTVILNPQQKVLATSDQRNAINHINDILREIRKS